MEIINISAICYSCLTVKVTLLKWKDNKKNWNFNVGSLPDTNEMLIWSLYTSFTITGRSLGSFMREMEYCNDHISNFGHNWFKWRFTNLSNRLSHAQTHVWKSIMKNYTNNAVGSKSCVNGKFAETKYPFSFSNVKLANALYAGPIPQKFTWSVEDNVNSLQFVACGDHGTSLLQFTAFIDVFDGYVWLFTIVTLVVGPIVLSCFSAGLNYLNFENICGYFMAILSFYLEKNDCLPEKPLILKLQLIFVGYLFGALVLSGAYKNDNINRMIQPRPPLTYFSVCSRSSDIFYSSFLLSKEITHTTKHDIRSNQFGMR